MRPFHFKSLRHLTQFRKRFCLPDSQDHADVSWRLYSLYCRSPRLFRGVPKI